MESFLDYLDYLKAIPYTLEDIRRLLKNVLNIWTMYIQSTGLGFMKNSAVEEAHNFKTSEDFYFRDNLVRERLDHL